MTTLVEIFINAFITLIVVIDPIGTAAVFCAMTSRFSKEQFRKTAFRAASIAFCLLIFFGLFGSALLQKLGITIPAFRIAGGILLFATAFRMLFSQPSPDTVDPNTDAFKDNDIAVFPIAIPLLAGPGCMTAIILLTARAHDAVETGAVLCALITAHLLALGCLLAAAPIQRMLGKGGVNILARVMGVILAAMSVQFVTDGLNGIRQIAAN